MSVKAIDTARWRSMTMRPNPTPAARNATVGGHRGRLDCRRGRRFITTPSMTAMAGEGYLTARWSTARSESVRLARIPDPRGGRR